LNYRQNLKKVLALLYLKKESPDKNQWAKNNLEIKKPPNELGGQNVNH